jgi:hypothetical protein
VVAHGGSIQTNVVEAALEGSVDKVKGAIDRLIGKYMTT